MKTFAWVFLILLAAAGAFGFGWYLGRQSNFHAKTAPSMIHTSSTNADSADLAAKVFRTYMFSRDFTELSDLHVVIEQLDSNRVEDAKHMLRLVQDGCIIGLDTVIHSPVPSMRELAGLDQLNESLGLSSQSERQRADRILARVARHRAGFPWTYTGSLPKDTNGEVEAKIEAILKRAVDSQTSTNFSK